MMMTHTYLHVSNVKTDVTAAVLRMRNPLGRRRHLLIPNQILILPPSVIQKRKLK